MTPADFTARMRETIARYYDPAHPTVMGDPDGIRRQMMAVMTDCLCELGYGEGVQTFVGMWFLMDGNGTAST